MTEARKSIKGKRLAGADRERLTKQAARLYGKGKSIREIAEEQGRSYGFVHRLLGEAGVELRSRGGDYRGRKRAAR